MVTLEEPVKWITVNGKHLPVYESGRIGNVEQPEKEKAFSIKSGSYGLEKRDVEQVEKFINYAIEHKYEEDGDSLEVNIQPKYRESLADHIKESFKKSLGWDMNVTIRRKAEGGTRSKLKDGGKQGKTYYTEIDIKRRK